MPIKFWKYHDTENPHNPGSCYRSSIGKETQNTNFFVHIQIQITTENPFSGLTVVLGYSCT